MGLLNKFHYLQTKDISKSDNCFTGRLNITVCSRTGQSTSRNEKDSRIFQSNLFEAQIHQQYSKKSIIK